ncbi:hypothetical protein [Zobellella denitrificans]|uniref:hypothetical protein n=1 Tax=Zobellella denitrificans TaxID=347534 RepID=UPI0012FD6F57|nr:hypothetical protein [Zobellella denitrificans]
MNATYTRTALARAEFFLSLAEQCTPKQRAEFEAFIEASIIFARATLHHLQNNYKRHTSWKEWFESIKGDPAVEFFRQHRNVVLKESSPKAGQIISLNSIETAAVLYYFEDPTIPATVTIRRHLESYTKILQKGEENFKTQNPMTPK